MEEQFKFINNNLVLGGIFLNKVLNVLVVMILIFPLLSSVFPSEKVYASGMLVKGVYNEKTRYKPGETSTIYVELENNTGEPFSGKVSLYFTHLGNEIDAPQNQNVSLDNSMSTTLKFTWSPPTTDYKGYHVEVLAKEDSGTLVDSGATAVDVSSEWTKFPRYGFVSNFDQNLDPNDLTSKMNRYLLNSVQYYDWQWKHHLPYSPDPVWKNIANRDVYRDIVQSFISNQQKNGMATMNYNLYGSAYSNYLTDGSGVKLEWGIFTNGDGNYDLTDQDKHSLPSTWATDKLYMFNPSDTNWQNHIFNEESKVFTNFSFDGFHIDSLGDRGDLWNWNQEKIKLKDSFVEYANNAKSKLNTKTAFNSVGTYGLDDLITDSSVDFIYSELWDNYYSDDYNDINNISERIQSKTDKGIVYAAYMNYEWNKSANSTYFNDHSVRLANATIFASGGSHIEIGDGEEMLSSEYFPNHKLKMSPALKDAMKNYYLFLTAYQNLLREGVKRGINKVELTGIPSSTKGEAGTVWKMYKSKPGYDIVHLINLENNTSTRWRDTNGNYPEPDNFTDIPVKMYYKGAIKKAGKLKYASPDFNGGKSVELTYTTGSDTTGNYITFTLPRLKYWDMLWLEKNTAVADTPPSSGLYSNNFEWYFTGTQPSDWYAREGTWSIVKPKGSTKELQTDGQGILEYAPGFSTGDYSVKAKVFTTSNIGSGSILARVQNDGGFYQLEVKDGNTWALWKFDGQHKWTEIASGPYSYKSNSYHDLKLECIGNKLTVYVNGSKKGTFTDTDKNPFYTGSIGLRSDSNPVRFDQIKVNFLQ